MWRKNQISRLFDFGVVGNWYVRFELNRIDEVLVCGGLVNIKALHLTIGFVHDNGLVGQNSRCRRMHVYLCCQARCVLLRDSGIIIDIVPVIEDSQHLLLNLQFGG